MPHKDTAIKVSLRSVDGYDTSTVSGAFGGGGHAAASSCVVPRAELDAWREMGQQ
jgi:nanoRNase/pAp phosphatase (c-di-AMP/oligoRNAs hydrolase)